MENNVIKNISPLDSRYFDKLAEIREYFSEYELIRCRIIVEIQWFISLSNNEQIVEFEKLSEDSIQYLLSLIENFNDVEALSVKAIEEKTNHDVKSVEYYLKEKCKGNVELEKYNEFWHFACTSEDINNLAYALMLQRVVGIVLKNMATIITQLAEKSKQYADIPMISKTHGQAASPTTFGKELANMVYRLYRQFKQLEKQPILGKLNGSVGNFNAHFVAMPNIRWTEVSKQFIESLGLTPNLWTTQIEPHDYNAEIAHNIVRVNTILIDMCRDFWTYISQDYLKQKTIKGEVGSSTMPHKVNPIDFENAEGNLGLSSAILEHMANKLPISRLQRDLSDSTVQRNWGVAFGHCLLAIKYFLKGFNKIEINQQVMDKELTENQVLITEAVQTIMRKNLIEDGYELMKDISRGQRFDKQALIEKIKKMNLNEEDRNRLLELTPQTYIGNAYQQALAIYDLIDSDHSINRYKSN